ncbi:regulation of nuclear pre-mRNA domain-containing protein 2-like [Stomoxys calcitrans]|uniref:regulation of nuclear pre-mRNA domain-containing protein 2-like n=1 Tax=Stomoxys calcitrans TaxID=35570 RepID=UPI0027E3987B|nr:regulation of nuclear pre-mRNA domain-containing protein 2-like [Stomoxys calcitrans]
MRSSANLMSHPLMKTVAFHQPHEEFLILPSVLDHPLRHTPTHTPASYTAPTKASVTSFISPTVTPCLPNGANTRLRALHSRCSAFLGVDGPPPSLATPPTPAPPSTTTALTLPPAPSTHTS